MASFGGKGEVSGSTTRTKGTRWYDWQEKLGKDIYSWLRPKVGKEATPYTADFRERMACPAYSRALLVTRSRGRELSLPIPTLPIRKSGRSEPQKGPRRESRGSHLAEKRKMPFSKNKW
jgi:hypothetical protein